MKGAATIGVFVVVALAAALVAMLLGQPQTPDAGEIVESVGGLVETLADSDARFVQQVFIWSTWSNGVYLAQSMPYTVLAVAGAVLALGLGLVVMTMVAVMGGQRGQ